MLTTMMAGGFYVTKIPAWLDWLGPLSFITYSYRALVHLEFHGTTFECDSRAFGPRCPTETHTSFDGFKGDFDSNVDADLAALALFAVALRLLAYLGLKRLA